MQCINHHTDVKKDGYADENEFKFYVTVNFFKHAWGNQKGFNITREHQLNPACQISSVTGFIGICCCFGKDLLILISGLWKRHFI